MSKLNQIIAVEKGTKSRAEKALTEAHHSLKKGDLLSGISRAYKPIDDNGEQLPPENKKVQLVAEDAIARASATLIELFDITATKDYANTSAKADVVVDGVTLIQGAPVSFLLWVEKRLTLLHEFIKELPTLSDADTWTKDHVSGHWVTSEERTHRTKKMPLAFEKSPATDKHPAQVEVVHEDKVVGYWHTVKRSGALEPSRVRTLLSRVEKLQGAVKTAREAANMAEAPKVDVGAKVLGFLFA